MFIHSTIAARSDARGCPISGDTAPALQAYEAALAAFQTWRLGAEPLLDAALHEAPQFVMAHVLRAWLRVCSRDPRRVLPSWSPRLPRYVTVREMHAFGLKEGGDYARETQAARAPRRRRLHERLGLALGTARTAR